MVEWIHDFVNDKSTFVYSLVSLTVMLSASKFLANVAANEVLDKIKKTMKEDKQ